VIPAPRIIEEQPRQLTAAELTEALDSSLEVPLDGTLDDGPAPE